MANFNYNKVILGGRITADPELKKTQQGVSVVSFGIAVNRRGKDAGTDFFTCTAWRETAEHTARYFRKGSSICVTGELVNRSWTDKNGNKRISTEINLTEYPAFVDSRNEVGTASNTAAPPANTSSAPAETPRFEELGEDDELPF